MVATKLQSEVPNSTVELNIYPIWFGGPNIFWSTTVKLPNQDEALAEEVIANHFLLGEEIKLAELKRDQKRRTAGGQQLVFKVDKNGAW